MEEIAFGLIPAIEAASSISLAALDEAAKSDDSDDSDLELLAVMQSCSRRKVFLGEKKVKITEYLPNAVKNYSCDDFRKHFRLQRSTVEHLCQLIGPEIGDNHAVRPGRRPADFNIGILLPIWILSNQESFRGICDRFGVGTAHGYRMFKRFCDVLSTRVSEFVCWPEGPEMSKTLLGFETLRQNFFPGVVGCVDGSYIPIRGLRAENDSYCTRKKFRAVILQAICGYQMRFIDVFVGWPGSCHDARVWRNSPIHEQLILNCGRFVPNDTNLLGDSAYPLEQFIMVPFRDNGYLTPKQRLFNKKLSSTRVVIENAFAHLKSRFRRLRYLDMIRMEFASTVIVTACILHNICVDQNDVCDEIEVDNDLVDSLNNGDRAVEAETKRNQIADHLFANK